MAWFIEILCDPKTDQWQVMKVMGKENGFSSAEDAHTVLAVWKARLALWSDIYTPEILPILRETYTFRINEREDQ